MTATVAETATLAHGYTMAEVEGLARVAVRRAWGGGSLDASDRQETAWYAIVEVLYTSTERPSIRDLIAAGTNAVKELRNEQFHHHGININTAEATPRFGAYWSAVAGPVDWTDALVERMALPQVLAVLSPGQYEALAALAAHGSTAVAARAIGANRGTFSAQVRLARKKIEALWYEGETPRRRVGGEDACRAGHARADHGFKGEDGKWACRVCQRNYSRTHYNRRRRASVVSEG